jgi:chromodomain-helicase-DNA-binding protein 4
MAAADEEDIDLSTEDEDYSLEDDVSDNDTTLQGNISGKRGQYSRRKSRKTVMEIHCTMEYGLLLHYEYSVLIYFANTLSLGNVDSIPLMEGEGRTLRVLGFNHAQRAMFLQTLNR